MTDREKFEAWAIKDYSWAEDMLSKAEFCHSDNDEWYVGIGIDPLFWLWRGWQAAKPQWIKCSDQTPDDKQECLVQTHTGWRYVSFYDEHSGLFFDMPGGNQISCIEHILVTHWQPLPEPPTK